MNFYEILGVGPDATDQQIKEGYRREAMKWHPDRHEGGAAAKGEATRRFKDLAEAYRTLRSAVERANYDRDLAQKLHQDYEARQQEEARRQREQSEQARWDQARQKQAHANQAGSDFQDTNPAYEEETASSDEANQMFFEQMLDLANELAGRGFPEFNIFKALIALGCPEALAKAVAATAAKKSQQQSSGSAGSSKTETETDPDAGNANSGPTREDYYKAAIGPKNLDFFLKKFKRFDQVGTAGFSWPGGGQFLAGVFWLFYRKMTLSAWVYLGLPFVLLLSVYMIFGSDVKEDSLPMSFYNIITAVAYWLFLPARMNAMYYNRVNKLILDARSQSNDRAVQLAYLEKHGNTNSFVGWLFFVLIVGGILTAVALPAYQDYTRRAQVASGLIVGTQAAKQIGDYYAINKTGPTDLGVVGFALAPSATVADVAFDGQTGILTITLKDSFFTAKSLLLVPSVTDGQVAWLCTSDGIAGQYLPQACKATQDQANARLAAIASASQAKDQAKANYDRALANIEARHPELNPDSPRYNAKSLAWVAERKAFHQERGQTATNALQLAAGEYVVALQQQSMSQAQQARTQDGTVLFGGVGKEVSLDFQSIEIRSLLQVFTDISGLKFTADDQVRGSVKIRVVDQPWTQALMQILQQNRLAIINSRFGYYVFPTSFSDDTAYRRASQSVNPSKPRSNQSQQNQRTGGVSQSEASRTICQTWPSACR